MFLPPELMSQICHLRTHQAALLPPATRRFENYQHPNSNLRPEGSGNRPSHSQRVVMCICMCKYSVIIPVPIFSINSYKCICQISSQCWQMALYPAVWYGIEIPPWKEKLTHQRLICICSICPTQQSIASKLPPLSSRPSWHPQSTVRPVHHNAAKLGVMLSQLAGMISIQTSAFLVLSINSDLPLW